MDSPAKNSEKHQLLNPSADASTVSTKVDNGEVKYNVCFMVQLVSLAALGGFLFGYDTGVIAGAQLYFVDTWPDITDSQIALIVSIALIGAAIGALFSGSLSDKIGRKNVILIADALFTVGAIIMAAAPTIAVLMVGRLIIGLGVGMASQIVPLYLSEVAPVEIRGKLVAFNVATITIAQLMASTLAYLIRPHWRIMLGLAGVPSLVQMIGMFFMPESPRWLGKVGRIEDQRKVMTLIYKP